MELLDGSTLTSYLKPGLAYDAQYAVPILRGLLSAWPKRIAKGSCTATSSPTTCFWFAIRPARRSSSPRLRDRQGHGFGRRHDVQDAHRHAAGHAGVHEPGADSQREGGRSRADLWSAAVILYELLTGREAFSAPTELAKLTTDSHGTPVPIDQGGRTLRLGEPSSSARSGARARAAFPLADEMERAMTTTDHARAGIGCAPTAASTTDMSPELPQGFRDIAADAPQITCVCRGRSSLHRRGGHRRTARSSGRDADARRRARVALVGRRSRLRCSAWRRFWRRVYRWPA